MRQWLCICFAVIGVLFGSSAYASNIPIADGIEVPVQEIQLRATTTEVAHLPEVLQAVNYSPVLHRVSTFMQRTPGSNADAGKKHLSPHIHSSTAAQLYAQAVPLHLAIRVLLI